MHQTFTHVILIYEAFKIQIILFFLYVYERRGGIMRQIMHEYCYICCGGGQL